MIQARQYKIRVSYLMPPGDFDVITVPNKATDIDPTINGKARPRDYIASMLCWAREASSVEMCRVQPQEATL